MLIDCDTCPGRGAGCTGCVVTALFGPPEPWPPDSGGEPGGSDFPAASDWIVQMRLVPIGLDPGRRQGET